MKKQNQVLIKYFCYNIMVTIIYFNHFYCEKLGLNQKDLVKTRFKRLFRPFEVEII